MISTSKNCSHLPGCQSSLTERTVMQAAVPHIYFASDLDRASEWQEALSTQFERFRFSTSEIEDPDTVVGPLHRPEGDSFAGRGGEST
jgi:hypothetical protein